jgi:hypothetical protein
LLVNMGGDVVNFDFVAGIRRNRMNNEKLFWVGLTYCCHSWNTFVVTCRVDVLFVRVKEKAFGIQLMLTCIL